MTIIEQIRAKIERRIKKEELYLTADNANNKERGVWIERDKELLSFLDTLESEKPMQEELEDEIERYLPKIPENPYNEELRVFARHFAQWGAIHLNARKEE